MLYRLNEYEYTLVQWFPTWVHGALSGPQKIPRGPQDSKFCITVNRRGSTEYRKHAHIGLASAHPEVSAHDTIVESVSTLLSNIKLICPLSDHYRSEYHSISSK